MNEDAWTNVAETFRPDIETMSKISVSEINSLSRCLKKHDYGYRQGLMSKDPPTYLSKGTYYHELWAAFLRSVAAGSEFNVDVASRVILKNRNPDRPPVQEPDRLQVNALFKKMIKDLDMSNLDVLAVEQEFYVNIGWWEPVNAPEVERRVLLHGIFDAVVQDRETGDIWVAEHKSAGRRWDEGRFMFDIQAKLYLAAWEALTDSPPIGILWNFMYPKATEQRQQFIDPVESKLLVEEVQRVINLRATGLVVRQPVFGCRDCWFKDLCYAELSGQGGEYLRESEYVIDTDKVARFADLED